jgi:transposase
VSSVRRSKYSEEFKRQAIKLVLEGDNSIKEVAESLKMSYELLKMWRREYMTKETKQFTHNSQSKENEELTLLRKENKRLKEENAILKKFAAILSKDQELA